MTDFISWQDLPKWVPGKTLLASDDLGWKNVGLRSYHYEGQDVIVPAMKDFMLVGYRAGVTPMRRRFDGRWTRETLSPGAASFLTRAQSAHWMWDEPVDVTHIYISGALMIDVASEMFDSVVSNVALEDVLRTTDPVIANVMKALAQEAREAGLGGPLYVESLTRALIVHLLRRYAMVQAPAECSTGELSPVQKRTIAEFVETNLSQTLDLSSMAQALGMTPCLFARHFKSSFGTPPYAYVISRRLERARHLLSKSDLAIKLISADCGFSDQAHMTRLFRRAHGAPPAEFRKSFQ
ncbi:helix-turn-helix domain-containing protein [Primorskyibacter marinus]|uniref:helix-turn-helix domain-containing protein n=1 Tax=Primorskyibacter marinus TaxID=1977320 RepID=UPI000E3030B5|nr:AraC family transcriptional regulator [Primorskyibacter marinus]